MADRLGVLGGTFDPVHIGHVVAGAEARCALGLHRVLFVVANRPWQKEGRVSAPARDRLDMVAAALAGIDGLEASAMEIDRGGDSYTADTLEALRDQDPSRELHLVVGADVAADLDTWVRVETIRRTAHLVVVARSEVDGTATAGGLAQRGWRVSWVPIPRIDVSSSDLRRRVSEGRSIAGLVPQPAVALISARGLYAGGR